MIHINTTPLLIDNIDFYPTHAIISFTNDEEFNKYIFRLNNDIIELLNVSISNLNDLNYKCYKVNVFYDRLKININDKALLIKDLNQIKKIIKENITDFVFRYNYYFKDTVYNIYPILEKINIKYQTDINDNSCDICFETITERIVLLPCGHATFCKNCILSLRRNSCPKCNKEINTFHQIYI